MRILWMLIHTINCLITRLGNRNQQYFGITNLDGLAHQWHQSNLASFSSVLIGPVVQNWVKTSAEWSRNDVRTDLRTFRTASWARNQRCSLGWGGHSTAWQRPHCSGDAYQCVVVKSQITAVQKHSQPSLFMINHSPLVVMHEPLSANLLCSFSTISGYYDGYY